MATTVPAKNGLLLLGRHYDADDQSHTYAARDPNGSPSPHVSRSRTHSRTDCDAGSGTQGNADTNAR